MSSKTVAGGVETGAEDYGDLGWTLLALCVAALLLLSDVRRIQLGCG
jgi:hypothetical protein